MGQIQLQRHSYRNKEDHKAILSPVPINTDPFVIESHSFKLRLPSVSHDNSSSDSAWKSRGSDQLLTTTDADVAGLATEDQTAVPQVSDTSQKKKEAPSENQTHREKADSWTSKCTKASWVGKGHPRH